MTDGTSAGLQDHVDACAALADAVDRLAALGHSNGRFLRELGRLGGVRRGLFWVTDAGSGGSNRVRGRGFRRAYDDGTDGQVRHFAGTVAVAARIGGGLTAWMTRVVLRDGPDSADGRLTAAAVEFTRSIRSGSVAQADAAAWVRSRLCGAGRPT
ncbi:hypothetical protein [Agromyces sp. LHK192]|uniref:hypothetical protein n=1 Tax=Agromyces sp. LHK192 TaxID=2498704 RepID=UPI000FD98B86|nr:hypothetical protein [Agromyces sp. LHK192]